MPIFLKSGLYYVNYRFEFENPILKWFFSDTLKQVKRISLSLNALMLSIAVTIGVDNMVKSFEETFSIWLDKRLITEMYVRADSDDLAIKISRETIKEKNVINVYPIIETKNDIDYTVQQLLEGHGYEIVESPLDCVDEINTQSLIL